jgi:hypothetical protein
MGEVLAHVVGYAREERQVAVRPNQDQPLDHSINLAQHVLVGADEL